LIIGYKKIVVCYFGSPFNVVHGFCQVMPGSNILSFNDTKKHFERVLLVHKKVDCYFGCVIFLSNMCLIELWTALYQGNKVYSHTYFLTVKPWYKYIYFWSCSACSFGSLSGGAVS